MMSDLYRWQAAMGSIAGALVADAIANGSTHWTTSGMRSLDLAEAMLSGTPVPIELESHVAVPTAIGLAASGAPLLMDPTTVALIDALRDGIDEGGRARPVDPLLAKAADVAGKHLFVHAVKAAGRRSTSHSSCRRVCWSSRRARGRAGGALV